MKQLVAGLAIVLGALGASAPTPPATSQNIWMSRSEALDAPQSGAPWTRLKARADETIDGSTFDSSDSIDDVRVFANALVYLRLPNIASGPPWVSPRGVYRQRVIDAIEDVVASTPNPTNEVAIVRNTLGYVIAADAINLWDADAGIAADFQTWLEDEVRPTLISQHNSRPNNLGLMAGSSRVAVAIYLGDSTDESDAWDVFRRWLGDTTSPFNYDEDDWGGSEKFVAWQLEAYPNYFGINRLLTGTTKLDCDSNAQDVEGVLPDDQRRGDCNQCGWDCDETPPDGDCCFTWPPADTVYAYEALQGAVAQAIIHSRRSRDPWTISSNALDRAYAWLADPDRGNKPMADAGGTDDYWTAWIINAIYHGGSEVIEEIVPGTGEQVDHTDWTTSSTSWL